MNVLLDSNFWFIQPSFTLNQFDLIFGYLFAGLLTLGIIVRIAKIFIGHRVSKKLLMKFFYPAFVIGLIGIFWFGLRFENTPIFAKRFWVGTVILGGIVWFGFFLKYALFKYLVEYKEFE